MFLQVKTPKSFDIDIVDRKDEDNDGTEVFNDGISECIKQHGFWEPFETEIFLHIYKSLYAKDDAFIDVGCQLGYYSLMHLALGVDIVTFERNPVYTRYFNRSILKNKFMYPRRSFNCNVGSFTDGSVLCLDDALSGIKSILSIKVDTEGAEPDIFRGAKKVLKSRVAKSMIIEFSPRFTTEYNSSATMSISEYEDLFFNILESGYKAYDIGLSDTREINFDRNPMLSSDVSNVAVESRDLFTRNLLEKSQTNFLFVRIEDDEKLYL
ncbi:FkbM family methyltransferase [Methylobacterium ajmalii]|uniref:FkbM family methyltransferase n=1 Tax=Methylobacterium ajmalii TaxID=2738439 RepID=A0ABU9ZRP7_9HYPH